MLIIKNAQLHTDYVAINSNVVGIDVVSPVSEKFVVDGKPNIFEQFIQKDVRYPGSASLLEEINSNIGKLISQNKVIQRELSELPKKHDMEEIQEKHLQKALKDEIKSLKRCLENQEAIHTKNSQNLKLLQDDINHQNKVLFSVFAGFIVAIFVLCLYNVPVTIAIPIISLNLYLFTTILW